MVPRSFNVVFLPFMLFLFSTSALFAGQAGYIQVESDPGVFIFLDGKFQGETKEEVGGLIVKNVSPGSHSIKAVREGFQPQTQTMEIHAGEVVLFKVESFIPKITIEQGEKSFKSEASVKMGSLHIQSLPVRCLVTISGLGITDNDKVKDEWRIKSVPVGRYVVKARAQGKILVYEADILPDMDTRLFFNFVEGTVQELSEKERRRKQLEARYSPGDTWREPATGMEFVWVPGGCYQMGCGHWTHSCNEDEEPLHEVCVDGFWIGRYEVTQAQWTKVMGKKNFGFTRGDNYPADRVSWRDANAFIAKLNSRSDRTFRLPTEAEWEYAARSGGKPEKYSGGGFAEEFAWYAGNNEGKLHPVGTKAPNGLGIYDMSGNVWEWCQDSYDKHFYSRSARVNPVASFSGPYRVLRGGSWDDLSRFIRTGNRYKRKIETRFMKGEFRNIGLRLVFSPEG